MGRYDGEDYPDYPICAPNAHTFQFNEICSRCRKSRDYLIRHAEQTLRALKPEPYRKTESPYKPRKLEKPRPQKRRKGLYEPRSGPYDY